MNDHDIPADLPYDVYAHLGRLVAALAQWNDRDDTRSQPEVRRAANAAMDTIDALLRELHELRVRLIGEIRASDDATAARADRLLAGTDALLGDLNRPAT